jgi:DNA-binding protein HU-beta
MAKVRGGIDLQGLIDLEAEFGTLLGGPAGLKKTKGAGVFVVPLIGKLVRVDRKARTGRNSTGEAIKTPARKVVRFRVAKVAKNPIVPRRKK